MVSFVDLFFLLSSQGPFVLLQWKNFPYFWFFSFLFYFGRISMMMYRRWWICHLAFIDRILYWRMKEALAWDRLGAQRKPPGDDFPVWSSLARVKRCRVRSINANRYTTPHGRPSPLRRYVCKSVWRNRLAIERETSDEMEKKKPKIGSRPRWPSLSLYRWTMTRKEMMGIVQTNSKPGWLNSIKCLMHLCPIKEPLFVGRR